MAFTVYGTPISVYVRVVQLLLEEAGAEYDLKSVDIFNGESQSAEYLAKNPFGKVPTLEADGKLIYETTTITAQAPKLRTWWEQASQLPNVKKVSA